MSYLIRSSKQARAVLEREARKRRRQLRTDLGVISDRDGIQYQAMARALGVRPGAVSKWRSGDCLPRADMLVVLDLLASGRLRLYRGIIIKPEDDEDED